MTLVLNPITSSPSNLQTSVFVENGRKGLVLQFAAVDANGNPDPTGYPLNVASASVTLVIPGSPAVNMTAGFDPQPNAASFALGGQLFDNSNPPKPVGQSVIVYYNGNFPPNTSITLSVTGVVGANGAPQPPPSPTFPNSVTFTSESTPQTPPRAPSQIELVFDISGSMGLPPIDNPLPPPSPQTRMAALQSAAQGFFLALPHYAWAGDRVGLAYFSDQATTKLYKPPPPAGVTLTSNMVSAVDTNSLNLMKADILAQGPTNSTSITSGLQLVQTAGFSKETNAFTKPKQIVVLFSDGDQNSTPPALIDDPPTPAMGTTPGSISIGGQKYPIDQIIPITAGALSDHGNTLQTEIGQALNNNQSFHVLQGPDVETFFTQVLTDTVLGDKVELVRDETGSVSRPIVAEVKRIAAESKPVATISNTTQVTQKFLANKNDLSLGILLTWTPNSVPDPDGARRTALLLTLTAPDGTVVNLTGRTTFAPGTSFTMVRFPLVQAKKVIDPTGEWTIGLDIGPDSPASQLNYHMIVLLDNPTLASEYRIAAQDIGTGEPVPLQVTLTEHGAPVPAAVVSAELIGPSNGLGNVLSTQPTPSGTANTGGDAIRSAAMNKLLLLLKSQSALFGTTSPTTVNLNDLGGGNYGVTFAGADKEGHYRFKVTVAGSSSQGPFQRTRVVTVFVRCKPDPAQTQVALLPSTNPLLLSLKVTPRDRLGSFVGPDLLPALTVLSSQGTIQQPLTDNLDGSYQISYLLPAPGSDPVITIGLGGTTITTTTGNCLRYGNCTGPPCVVQPCSAASAAQPCPPRVAQPCPPYVYQPPPRRKFFFWCRVVELRR